MCSRVVVNISNAYFPFYLEETLEFEKVNCYHGTQDSALVFILERNMHDGETESKNVLRFKNQSALLSEPNHCTNMIHLDLFGFTAKTDEVSQ